MNNFYEAAREFARVNGDVLVYKTNGTPTLLKDGEPDIIRTVEMDADVFEFAGKKYSRAQFVQLVYKGKL
jgi:hypothetical protein